MAKAATATKFTPLRRDEYLRLMREGKRRTSAARALGLDPRTVERFKRDNPDFAADCERAEMEANELVEEALFAAARDGNTTAQQVWLYNRLPDRWKDQRGRDRLEVMASATAQAGVTVDASHLDSEIDRAIRELSEEMGRNAALRAEYGRDRAELALPADVEFEPAP